MAAEPLTIMVGAIDKLIYLPAKLAELLGCGLAVEVRFVRNSSERDAVATKQRAQHLLA